MRWEMLTLLSHGAFVTMIDKTAYDGGLDPVAYQRIGDVLREARAKRDHFGQTPVPEVGLYYSARTRDWIGRENPGNYFQSLSNTSQLKRTGDRLDLIVDDLHDTVLIQY
jgi:hypothetical protein